MMKQIITVYSRPKKLFPLFSWLIRLYEITKFSHVAVMIHFEAINTIAVFEASGTNVKFVNYKDWMERNEIVHGYLHHVDKTTWRKLTAFAMRNVDKKYGVKQVFGMAYARLFKKKNPWADGKASYVCSELVGYILKHVMGDKLDLSKLEYEGPKYLQRLEEEFNGET